MTKSDPLLSKSTFVGILAEVRAGPLNGLRWYWDFAPKVTTVENNENLSFAWSRATLGWSFGFNYNTFIDKMDITPKIGAMSLDASIGIPSPVSGQITDTARFRQANVLNLGIEAGIESHWPWILTRLWAATDISGFVNIDEETTVKSLRGGADAYFDLFKVSNEYKVVLLMFSTFEKVSLLRKRVPNEEEIGNTGGKLAGLSYQVVFAGLGLTVSW